MNIELEQAIRSQLGDSVYVALKQHRIAAPELLKLACLKAFAEASNGHSVDTLRTALNYLQETGLIK